MQKSKESNIWVVLVLIGLVFMTAGAAGAQASFFSDEHAWDDGTSFNFRVVSDYTYPHFCVFIDFDNNPGTGYAVNGIGADYMIEDDKLYHSLKNGPEWKWDSGNPIVVRSTPGLRTFAFSVPLTSIGSPASAAVTVEGIDAQGELSTDPNVTKYVQGVLPAGESPGPPASGSSSVQGASGGGNGGQPASATAQTPGRGGFSNELVSDDGVNIYFRVDCAYAYPHLNLYVDADSNDATGYKINGIGADYMIQDDKLFRSALNGATWIWGTGDSEVVRSIPSPNTLEFAVPLAAIGSPAQALVVFQGIDANGNKITDPTVAKFVSGGPAGGGAVQTVQSGAPLVVDDLRPGWTWSGMVEVDDDQCRGGTEHAGGPGTYAAYTFDGSDVAVYATTGPTVEVDGRIHKLGRMKILLDGKSVGEYSLSQGFATYESKVYDVTGLAPGNHVLQLVSDAGWIDVDYLTVASNGQVAPATGSQ